MLLAWLERRAFDLKHQEWLGARIVRRLHCAPPKSAIRLFGETPCWNHHASGKLLFNKNKLLAGPPHGCQMP
ncbi:hypothetical protein [Roseovarius sp. D0-M9]|uniref:hypothetical protein n=1 Tax=Roseovarius sp. D0-M9 TaxID=3127117 RepID=UPI00300FDFAC